MRQYSDVKAAPNKAREIIPAGGYVPSPSYPAPYTDKRGHETSVFSISFYDFCA